MVSKKTYFKSKRKKILFLYWKYSIFVIILKRLLYKKIDFYNNLYILCMNNRYIYIYIS